MGKTVERVSYPKLPPKLKRVAAYARVSSGKDAMLHSLSAQISYYNDLIQHHPGWEFAGVYADEAKTGTKDSRENFQRLLKDCLDGKVDMVISKSISRFARNTVTLLETIRELKAAGVDVFFEEQNIHTMSSDGELMISILASYAQEESLSASENQKWRIRKCFESGIPCDGTLLGYRYKDGHYVVVPEEATVVRRIYDLYLSGKGIEAIVRILNAENIPTRYGNAWRSYSVSHILQNYTYTGNLLLQKTFRENHLTKRKIINEGQLPKYHVANAHEAIISLKDYEAVQEEIKRRAEKYTKPDTKHGTYVLSGRIVCGCCGAHYRRKVTHGGPVWICHTYNRQGKAACPSKAIPESVMDELTADIPMDALSSIMAENGNRVIFRYLDGREVEKQWQDRSRSNSWTEEMKNAARQRSLERRRAK